MSDEERRFVQKYFTKSPEYMHSLRNRELVTQMKIGGCDCDQNTSDNIVGDSSYDYSLKLGGDYWEQFIRGGDMPI